MADNAICLSVVRVSTEGIGSVQYLVLRLSFKYS